MNMYILDILKLILTGMLNCIPFLIGIVFLIISYMVSNIILAGMLVLVGLLFIGPAEISYLGYRLCNKR